MRISMKVDYGVRALIDLAQHAGSEPVQTSDIASRQSVPEPYLDQLLAAMRKVGFIKSRRGPHGGYVLAVEPAELSIDRVISALEGPTVLIDCLDGSMDCNQSGHCAQQDLWRNLDTLTKSVLRSTSLADLALSQKTHDQQTMYYI